MDEWFEKLAANETLPNQVAEQLWHAGFAAIEGVVPQSECARLADAYDRAILQAHPDNVSIRSSIRVSDFVNRGPEFDRVYLYGPLLAANCRVIGRPFRLSTMHARTLMPGTPAQGLHVDFARDAGGWPMVGFILMIDEFRIDNGATQFVPGSHHSPAGESGPTTDETAVSACGPAGSMVIYNGSVRHGYGPNNSAQPRRSLQGAFIRREASSGVDLAARMLPATLQRISDLAKYLLALEKAGAFV